MKRNERKDWEEEFDRRVASGNHRTDRMTNFLNIFRPSELRVEDDEGTMRRRNGEGCCGCGKWSSETYRQDPVWDKQSHHHDDHHHDDDDEPKLFLGLF